MKSISYPPGPKGLPLFGSILEMYRDPIRFLQKISSDYGDIVYFKLGMLKYFLVNNPEYIEDVLANHYGNFVKGRGWQRGKALLGEGLLTSEGEFHRRQRRSAQPAFHQKRIAAYGTFMSDYAVRIQEDWRDASSRDISQDMYRLTLSVVGKTLFGADVEPEAGEISEALTTIRKQWWRTAVLPYVPFSKLLEKLPIPAIQQFNEAANRLDATVYRIISERRMSGEDRGDLLSMLLLTQDEESDTQGMTDLQVRDEVMTLFLAGHETTASSLTWAWYLLSQHPEVEEKLHVELDSVLDGRLPTVNDLKRLKYTRMIFDETLRLYPPIWLITRRTLKDYNIGSFTIPADSAVQMCPYLIQRDPRYFSKPLSFDPKRWDLEANDKRPNFSYFPFGGGPRRCLGDQFALTEAVLVLATIAQRWKMRLIPGQHVEAETCITLRPKYGMMMQVEERTTEKRKELIDSS